MNVPEHPREVKNQLLASLPAEEYQRLRPHLQLIPLMIGQTLQRANQPIEWVYFPYHTLISLLTTMEDGATIEVGMISREGFVGMNLVLGSDTAQNDAIVQVPSHAIRVPAHVLKAELERSEQLRTLLLRYVQVLYNQVSRSAACNSLHPIRVRMARWLLIVQDRLESDELSLTQEFLSHMLGVRRSGVTEVARMLQQAGMIRYNRGKITILDKAALEATACECYRIIQAGFDQLSKPSSR